MFFGDKRQAALVLLTVGVGDLLGCATGVTYIYILICTVLVVIRSPVAHIAGIAFEGAISPALVTNTLGGHGVLRADIVTAQIQNGFRDAHMPFRLLGHSIVAFSALVVQIHTVFAGIAQQFPVHQFERMAGTIKPAFQRIDFLTVHPVSQPSARLYIAVGLVLDIDLFYDLFRTTVGANKASFKPLIVFLSA